MINKKDITSAPENNSIMLSRKLGGLTFTTTIYNLKTIGATRLIQDGPIAMDEAVFMIIAEQRELCRVIVETLEELQK